MYDIGLTHVALPAKETLSQQMIAKIDTPEARKIEGLRLAIVEPVWGNIRSQKRLDRLTLRGKIKINLQWMLSCMVHNIEKLVSYGMVVCKRDENRLWLSMVETVIVHGKWRTREGNEPGRQRRRKSSVSGRQAEMPASYGEKCGRGEQRDPREKLFCDSLNEGVQATASSRA